MDIKQLRLLIIVGMLIASSIAAEEIRQSMQKAYVAFRNLQPYVSDEENFRDPKNSDRIKQELATLSGSFHRAENLKSQFRNEPGFVQTLNIVSKILEDATKRFSEGEKDYSFWRLRVIPLHCTTCHAAHNAAHLFHDDEAAIRKLPVLKQADFYFSTRQSKKAKNSYVQALNEEQSLDSQMEILRRLIIIGARFESDPAGTHTLLTKLLPKLKLRSYERDEIQSWLASLNEWATSNTSHDSVSEIEQFMRQAIAEDVFRSGRNDVKLLKVTGELHSLLNEKSLSNGDRARALYLLGLAYYEMPLFFVSELPEMYLELCIEEYPGAQDARMAFKLYEKIVTIGFSGSGGVQMPTEVKLKLMELYNKANNIPQIEGFKIVG